MIGFLHGTILYLESSNLLLLVNGVGYEINITDTLANKLKQHSKQQPLDLYIHSSIRDDAHRLFGFIDKQEKQMFRLLIKVNSIGVKVALAMLSHFDVPTLIRAISTKDIKTLCLVAGVGKKGASRLVLEMQDSLSLKTTDAPKNNNLEDAMAALTALGFTEVETQKLLSVASKEQPDATVEALIQSSLILAAK